MLKKSVGGPLGLPFKIGPQHAADSVRRVTMDLASDAHARAAIEAYADSCATETPWLADKLRARLETFNRLAEHAADHVEGIAQADTTAMPLTHCEQTARRLMAFARMCAGARDDYSAAAWDHVMKSFDRMLTQMR
jgi:hypothetical protein